MSNSDSDESHVQAPIMPKESAIEELTESRWNQFDILDWSVDETASGSPSKLNNNQGICTFSEREPKEAKTIFAKTSKIEMPEPTETEKKFSELF